MSCQGNSDCTCGCCSGISVKTPQGEANLPGLSAVAYRTGTWAMFRESMLARLSSSDYPALASLKSRDNDDFSIALLDASAVMMDILTFYQERLANESYLRTATRLDSLAQLSRLIGYRPSPGVSASTYLAFKLTAAPGQPENPGTTAITIPAGSQVQSVPAQGQTPQSFQTSADILGKPDWNALKVQTGIPWQPESGQTSVYLRGTATQLQPGDAFLIVGDERLENLDSSYWDVRIVSAVQTDTVLQRTLVTWKEPLGGGSAGSAQGNPKFFAMRQRAALFGYNAINPLMLARATLYTLKKNNLVHSYDNEWDFGTDNGMGKDLSSVSLVDLDAAYPKLVPEGWMALYRPDGNNTRSPSGYARLYQIKSVTTLMRSDYGISAKISRISTDSNADLASFYDLTRYTSVLAQSEILAVAEQPLDHPLYGTLLDLEVVRQDLVGVTAVAISGKRQKIAVNPGITGLKFTPDDGPPKVPLNPGDILTLLQPPAKALCKDGTIPDWTTFDDLPFLLNVSDESGRSGTVDASLSQFTLAASSSNDPVVQEFALVASVNLEPPPFVRTCIVLKNPLTNCYDRTVTSVNANVGPATAGRPVMELLGSGSAATTNQAFTLKQSPLTYVQAATPSGSASSLKVSANGVAWSEVQSLYNQSPSAQVYETLNLPGGTAKVQFGDNVEGATLPTGQSNIVASFRVGLGSAGNVAAGAITTLVDRPLGVTGVTNPMAATGGQDAQSIEDIRANAPQSVLTLGRAVSITDYQNFAATFAGIAKAHAIWIPNGPHRGVFLTVAGVDGIALDGSQTLANLVAALKGYGNPNVAIYVQSFYETVFGLSADIAYDLKYDAKTVKADVLSLLSKTYCFASRTFGQGVSADEIAALIQGVEGIVAVNVTSLNVVATSAAGDLGSAAYSVSAYNNWVAQKKVVKRPYAGPARICPYVPVAVAGALPAPAEILVLEPGRTRRGHQRLLDLPAPAEILVLDPDPAAVVLGVMT